MSGSCALPDWFSHPSCRACHQKTLWRVTGLRFLGWRFRDRYPRDQGKSEESSLDDEAKTVRNQLSGMHTTDAEAQSEAQQSSSSSPHWGRPCRGVVVWGGYRVGLGRGGQLLLRMGGCRGCVPRLMTSSGREVLHLHTPAFPTC